MSGELPSHAEIVIVGGGVAGLSVAYHLAKLGRPDVVLVERDKLTSGTTWHSAGNIVRLIEPPALAHLFALGAELYPTLEAETGQATGWRNCGRVMVARTEARLADFKRLAAIARAVGGEAELVTPSEIGALWPLMRTDDLVGGVWSPGDGRVNPSDLCMAYAKGARAGGVRIVEDTRLTGIRVRQGGIAGVETARGAIACEVVVNCAGLWAPAIGRLCGVAVPLHAVEHFYMQTRPIDGVNADLPTFRDPDGAIYGREEVGGLLVGCFEPEAKPLPLEALPANFAFSLLNEDWDHFEPFMKGALHRIPALEAAQVRMLLNGPESFTPDGLDLMGEAPEVERFYVLAGLNSAGVTVSGGAGRALAEWIVEGYPTLDVAPFDIRRFHPKQGDPAWLRKRVVEVPGAHFSLGAGLGGFRTARPLRASPLYTRFQAAGARFVEANGWEEAQSFAANGDAHETAAAAELAAAREGSALFDRSSAAKIRVAGAEAEALLQELCSADKALAEGALSPALLLNGRGRIEGAVEAARLDADVYLLMASPAQATRLYHWIRRRIAATGRMAAVADVTEDFALLTVAGAAAMAPLASIAGGGTRIFPHRRFGAAMGDLLIPAGEAEAVHERLLDGGARHAGRAAWEALRLAAGAPAWGAEISPDVTPEEVGLGALVDLAKAAAFVGREACERRRAGNGERRLMRFTVAEPVALKGGEPVLHDGAVAGLVTSASTVGGGALALGFIDGGRADGGGYEIDTGERRVAAKASRAGPVATP